MVRSVCTNQYIFIFHSRSSRPQPVRSPGRQGQHWKLAVRVSVFFVLVCLRCSLATTTFFVWGAFSMKLVPPKIGSFDTAGDIEHCEFCSYEEKRARKPDVESRRKSTFYRGGSPPCRKRKKFTCRATMGCSSSVQPPAERKSFISGMSHIDGKFWELAQAVHALGSVVLSSIRNTPKTRPPAAPTCIWASLSSGTARRASTILGASSAGKEKENSDHGISPGKGLTKSYRGRCEKSMDIDHSQARV